MSKILIVIDCQNDFIDGVFGTPEAKKILPTIQEKIDALKLNDILLCTRDTHYSYSGRDTIEKQKLPRHCIAGTLGQEFTDKLDLSCCNYYKFIGKQSFAYPWWNNYLADFIDDDTEIEICGLCTDICVISNALALRSTYSWIPITVDANACAGTTPEMHEMALKIMNANLIDIVEK